MVLNTAVAEKDHRYFCRKFSFWCEEQNDGKFRKMLQLLGEEARLLPCQGGEWGLTASGGPLEADVQTHQQVLTSACLLFLGAFCSPTPIISALLLSLRHFSYRYPWYVFYVVETILHRCNSIALGVLFLVILANKQLISTPSTPKNFIAECRENTYCIKTSVSLQEMQFNFNITSLLCLFLSQAAALQLPTEE